MGQLRIAAVIIFTSLSLTLNLVKNTKVSTSPSKSRAEEHSSQVSGPFRHIRSIEDWEQHDQGNSTTSEPSAEIDFTTTEGRHIRSKRSSDGLNSTSEARNRDDGTISEPSPHVQNATSQPSPEGHSTTFEPSPGGRTTTSEPIPDGHNTTFEPSPEVHDTIPESAPGGHTTTSEPIPDGHNTTFEPSPEVHDTISESAPGGHTTTSEPIPDGHNTTFEPSPEVHDGTSEPRPGSHTSKSEPSPEAPPSAEPNPEPEGWPEPGPAWEKAYRQWQAAWPIHTYTFATIFLLMALYSGYYVIVNIKDGLDKKYLSISLNVMMFFMSITRAFVLILDPYHQGSAIQNKLPMQLLWSIGSPCLLASDSLCILALAESARVNVVHQRLQRLPNIVVIVALHFILVITTETVVTTYTEAKSMILYCQIFATMWGLTLGVGYFMLAYKIDKQLFKAAGRRKSRSDRIYMMLIYLSGASNLFGCLLILYTAIGVFGVYSDVEFVEAWPWYTLQTGFRVAEVIAALLVFTVSAKRNRIKNKVDGKVGIKKDTFKGDDETPSCTTNSMYVPKKEGRRLSMFSGLHQSKVSAVANNAEMSPARSRRISVFSGLHQSKVSAVTNKDEMSPARARKLSLFSGLHQSKVSAVTNNDEMLPAPARTRRVSMFSALQQTKVSLSAKRNQVSVGQDQRVGILNTSSKAKSSAVQVSADTEVEDDVGQRLTLFSGLRYEAKKPAEGKNNARVERSGLRTSLFAGLHETMTQIIAMQIVEDEAEEEDVEEEKRSAEPNPTSQYAQGKLPNQNEKNATELEIDETEQSVTPLNYLRGISSQPPEKNKEKLAEVQV